MKPVWGWTESPGLVVRADALLQGWIEIRLGWRREVPVSGR